MVTIYKESDYSGVMRFLVGKLFVPLRFEDLVHRYPEHLKACFVCTQEDNIAGVALLLDKYHVVADNADVMYELIDKICTEFIVWGVSSKFVVDLLYCGYQKNEEFELYMKLDLWDKLPEIDRVPGHICVRGSEKSSYNKQRCFKDSLTLEAYQNREKSRYFKHSMERIVLDEEENVVGYAFCYIDPAYKCAYLSTLCGEKSEVQRLLVLTIAHELRNAGVRKIVSYGDGWFLESCGFVCSDCGHVLWRGCI